MNSFGYTKIQPDWKTFYKGKFLKNEVSILEIGRISAFFGSEKAF